jgi:hypothetical protein
VLNHSLVLLKNRGQTSTHAAATALCLDVLDVQVLQLPWLQWSLVPPFFPCFSGVSGLASYVW